MKTIMGLYMHNLHEEKKAFWDYMELLNCETHKDRKAIWYAIAADELQHFAKIKDTVWSDMTEHTEMEQAFYHELHEEYEAMKKCLEKHK